MLLQRREAIVAYRELHHFLCLWCSPIPKSVLGPLLFVVYITCLSTFISCLSLNHHLYADDTWLCSFVTLIFDSNINHIQNALQQISSWVSANLVCVNCCKTEFLLVRLNMQLSNEYPTCHWMPCTLLTTLTSSFMNNSSNFISPNPAVILFINFIRLFHNIMYSCQLHCSFYIGLM